MPFMEYVPRRFNKMARQMIQRANAIIEAYQAEGYVLTLRQLYYRFVAQGWIPNTQKDYKRLGSVINDARLAGEIDWDAIEDRTRELHKLAMWESPEDIIAAIAEQYREELWLDQHTRVEVWVEKEALEGVLIRACDTLQVPVFATRGHPSQSTMWRAAERFQTYNDAGQEVVVLHFSDHDPSGVDMTRDVDERLNKIFGVDVDVRRIALTMEQVRRYNPPPNPAKTTDSRSAKYIAAWGTSSWELDALEPNVLAALVTDNVMPYIDIDRWQVDQRHQDKNKRLLGLVSERWPEVVTQMSKKKKAD
jgi:hypothetical protein